MSTLRTKHRKAAAGAATARPPKVLYDFNALPDPVKRMLQQIAAAAAKRRDRDDAAGVRIERAEADGRHRAYVDDPIAFWKKASADGKGRDVLAAMLNVLVFRLSCAWGKGKDEMYVWPYFAETDLAKLTPAQEVELYRIVPPAHGARDEEEPANTPITGSASAPNGVWHYFLQ